MYILLNQTKLLTIFPEAKIKAVVLGSLILITTAEKRYEKKRIQVSRFRIHDSFLFSTILKSQSNKSGQLKSHSIKDCTDAIIEIPWDYIQHCVLEELLILGPSYSSNSQLKQRS